MAQCGLCTLCNRGRKALRGCGCGTRPQYLAAPLLVRAPGSLTERVGKSPTVALRTPSLNGPMCHSKDHVLCVTHTFKDSNIPKERLVAMVISQGGYVPRALRLPGLPLWGIAFRISGTKTKFLLSLGDLCLRQVAFGKYTARICSPSALGTVVKEVLG